MADSACEVWGGSQRLAQRGPGKGQSHRYRYCQGLDPSLSYYAAQEIPQSPGSYFFLWPLLGAIHFITLLLLFSSLAHKQCGQFPFTCPGISDSSPAGVALSGYTVECLANKIHKTEIGKSMPLLITLCHLSRELREGLPPVLAPETLKGRLPGHWVPAGPAA